MSRVRTLLAAQAVFAAASAPAAGQVHPYEPERGFLSGVTAGAEAVFSRCITDLTLEHRGAVQALGCVVVDSIPLGPGPDHAAWMVRYLRRAVADHGTRRDTLEVDELVLVDRIEGTDGWEARWHTRRARYHELLQEVSSAFVGGGVLVRWVSCLNGTGGCTEHFLFGAGDWAVVEEPYLDDLAARVPEGWSLHKGRSIDLATFEGRQPIARPDDGNCCPSGMIDFRVELRDGALHLVDARVVTPGAAGQRAIFVPLYVRASRVARLAHRSMVGAR